MQKLSTSEFINRANKIHNYLYNYSKVDYKHSQVKICIIDFEFGEFWQKPNDHLNGQGCPAGVRNTQQFIQKANKIHNYFYDYSKTEYERSNIKVCITDPDHGEFWQIPKYHLRGCGSPERSYNRKTATQKDHIIPLAILGSRLHRDIDLQRPLYKFLNSSQNIQFISGKDNITKSDWIEFSGGRIRARNVRNNYNIIGQLTKELLDINIDDIILEDKIFCQDN